jgi:hypothetical protein
MKNRAPYLLVVICILFNLSTSFAQITMQPINGWNMEEKNGSYIFKPAKASGDNKEFIYEVMPLLKPAGQSFDDWFNYAIDKDLQLSGYTLPAAANRKNITSNQTIFSFSSEVTDKKGKAWYITYISYQTAENEYRLARVISSPDIKFYASCMRPAASHFGMLAKQTGTMGSVARNTYVAPPEPAKEEDHYLALAPDAADKALKSADIKGVLINLDNSNNPDGSMLRVYKPYLVLNDGSIYSDPVLSPYNFNAELSKQKEPKKWGTWKLKGNVMVVSWPGRNQTEKWTKNWFWATPAMNSERIEGSYITRTGKDNESLLNNDKAGTCRNISLNKSGQFTMLPLAENNNGLVSASSADYTKRNEAGTYKLNEYSIELHFNNGNVLRRAFYFYLHGKTHFGIGNFVYVPKRYVEAN